jgi:hypothetical protein
MVQVLIMVRVPIMVRAAGDLNRPAVATVFHADRARGHWRDLSIFPTTAATS